MLVLAIKQGYSSRHQQHHDWHQRQTIGKNIGQYIGLSTWAFTVDYSVTASVEMRWVDILLQQAIVAEGALSSVEGSIDVIRR